MRMIGPECLLPQPRFQMGGKRHEHPTGAKTTIRVGSTVLRIGRKILDIVTSILADFPMATTGTIFGAVFGYLVASVPIIGFLFGPFIGALAIAIAIAFGFAAGAMHDLGNIALERRIRSSLVPFETLKPKV